MTYTKFTSPEGIAKRRLAWKQAIKEQVDTRFFLQIPPRAAADLREGNYHEDKLHLQHPQRSMYFYGESRTGKTMTIYAAIRGQLHHMVTNYQEGQNYTWKVLRIHELMENLRRFYSTNNTAEQRVYLESVSNVDLLVLDDIGVEKYTEWSYSQLYNLIDYRYMHYLPTWYTSNLSPEELLQKIPDQRICSRIFADCRKNFVEFTNSPFL